MTDSNRPIAFLLGSDSDLPVLEGAFSTLQDLGVGFHVRVLSAHRTPDEACEFARSARENGAYRRVEEADYLREKHQHSLHHQHRGAYGAR